MSDDGNIDHLFIGINRDKCMCGCVVPPADREKHISTCEAWWMRALDNRTARLTRLQKLHAPEPIIENEMELIAKAEQQLALIRM